AAAVSAAAARRVSAGLLWASIAVLFVSSLSGALGRYHYASLLALVDLGALLSVLVLVEAVSRGREDRGVVLLDAIALSGLAQSGLVLAEWAEWIAGSPRSAWAGTLLNSDHAAAYLLLAFWALVSRGERDGGAGTPRRLAIARAVGGSVLLGSALLEASRGALLGLAARGGRWPALRVGAISPRARRGLLAAAASVLLIGGLLVAHRFSTRDDPYRWDRLRLWRASFQVVASSPWLGTGHGVFSYATAPWDFPRRDAPVRFAKHIEATHSDP